MTQHAKGLPRRCTVQSSSSNPAGRGRSRMLHDWACRSLQGCDVVSSLGVSELDNNTVSRKTCLCRFRQPKDSKIM